MKKRETLENLAQEVSSKEDFVSFLHLLRENFRQEKEEWENQTLDEFLMGLNGFVADMDGYYKRKGIDAEEPSWQIFAEMLLASRVYE